MLSKWSRKCHTGPLQAWVRDSGQCTEMNKPKQDKVHCVIWKNNAVTVADFTHDSNHCEPAGITSKNTNQLKLSKQFVVRGHFSFSLMHLNLDLRLTVRSRWKYLTTNTHTSQLSSNLIATLKLQRITLFSRRPRNMVLKSPWARPMHNAIIGNHERWQTWCVLAWSWSYASLRWVQKASRTVNA